MVDAILKSDPSSTSEWTARFVAEWVRENWPVVAYSYKSSRGHDLVQHKFCDDVLKMCPSDMVVTELFAIPDKE